MYTVVPLIVKLPKTLKPPVPIVAEFATTLELQAEIAVAPVSVIELAEIVLNVPVAVAEPIAPEEVILGTVNVPVNVGLAL